MLKLFFIALLSFIGLAHPFYLGVTDLKYNAKEQALQGTVKLFTSDLESALEKINKKKVDLINVKDTAATNRLVELYLKTHLQLKLNGQARSFELLGFEREEEAIWMYIEFKNCELPKKAEVQNTLLFDFLPAQTNIVRFSIYDLSKSLKAVNPEKDFLFEF